MKRKPKVERKYTPTKDIGKWEKGFSLKLNEYKIGKYRRITTKHKEFVIKRSKKREYKPWPRKGSIILIPLTNSLH